MGITEQTIVEQFPFWRAALGLHGDARPEDEARLVGEMRDKGALVLGFGGPGDVSVPLGVAPAPAGLAVLPALQLIGERVAQAHGLDTVQPRHLTKVVTLAP